MPLARLIRSPATRARLLEAVVFAGYALVAFYPLSFRAWDHIGYIGDSLESVYLVAWNVHQVTADPLRMFQANILHPTRDALALTDHRLLPSLLVAPVVWLTGNPVFAGNISLLAASVVAALGAARLARVLGMDGVPALAAGALYAFHTYQLNEAPRLNIVWHGFVALALAELVLYLRTGERRHAAALAGLMLLQGLSANYHLLYGVLVIGLALVVSLVAQPGLTLRRLPALGVVALVAAICYLPVALPYLRAARTHGYVRELPAGVDLAHYVSTSPWNVFYGAIGAPVRLQQQGPHFIGFVSLGLAFAALGAWAARRNRDPDGSALPSRAWVPAAAGLGAMLVVLSLGRDMVAFGSTLGPGPYRLLYTFVPGFTLVRIPERLALLAMLFVALLVARGLWLLGRTRAAFLVLPLAAAVPLEHLSPAPALHRVPVTSDLPAVYGWLARDGAAAVAEVPGRGEGLVRLETLEMYFSTAHFKPIVHGYTAYPPQIGRALRRAVLDFPAEVTLQALQRVGVDTVVVHRGRAGGRPLDPGLGDSVRAGRLRPVARFEGAEARLFESTADEVYRIVPAPPLAAAPFPSGRRLRADGWRYRSNEGLPALAGDGDLATAWVIEDSLKGNESIRVLFEQPVAVTGVVIPVRASTVLPTRFRVEGRDPAGGWTKLAAWDDAHLMQLLDGLRRDPATAAIGFDLGGRELAGVSLEVEPGGESFDGWRLPELEIWTR